MFLRENEIGRRVAPHLRSGQTVLDYGSGTGRIDRWLARHTGALPVMADLVAYPNRCRELPFLELDDPFHVPAADRSFDAVLMLFALHHNPFASQGKMVAEAVRLARGRVIVLEDTPFHAVDRLFNVAWDRVLNIRHGVPTPFTFRPVRQWLDLFMEHGLRAVHVESYRPKWPTLMTYHHTLFVLDREEPPPEGKGPAGG